ncbi:unnamed protein product, partial [Coccothraustes coccothraustes]
RVQEGVKPLRGKRVGPAQSARRIQPGESRSAGAGSADPRLRLPSVPRANPVRGGGPGGAGRRGDRRPAGGRPWPGAFPPRRCAATGSGSAGKASGGQVARRRASGGGCYSPRAAGLAESRGRGRGPPPRPPPPPSAAPWRGASLSLPPPPSRGRGGGGRRPRSAAFGAGVRGPGPPAPGAAVNRGGLSSVRPDRAAPPGRAHGPRSGARGPRRCRLPTRPVLKHGPRSLARARVRGRRRKPAAQ